MPIDAQQINAAVSILNSMAHGLIPVRIDDSERAQVALDTIPSEEEFKASVKLKLRAIAIADRLAATDHVRRKAHRDLAIWYMELGKVEMAEKEKRVLYELVGIRDETILYPQEKGCGRIVWWQRRQDGPEIGCGMG